MGVLVLLALIALIFFYRSFRESPVRAGNVYVSKSSKPDELKYFLETAPYLGKTIIKWDRDIRVQILTGASAKDSILVKEILKEVAPALGKIKIYMVHKEGNLTVTFVHDPTVYDKMAAGIIDEGIPKAYAAPHFMNWGMKIKSVEIVIGPLATGVRKGRIIRHEFAHALGLWEHTKTRYNDANLMGKIIFFNLESSIRWDDSPYFPRIDLGALTILYNDSMPNNIRLNELLKVIDTASAPLQQP